MRIGLKLKFKIKFKNAKVFQLLTIGFNKKGFFIVILSFMISIYRK